MISKYEIVFKLVVIERLLYGSSKEEGIFKIFTSNYLLKSLKPKSFTKKRNNGHTAAVNTLSGRGPIFTSSRYSTDGCPEHARLLGQVRY